MSILALIKGKGPSGYGYASTAEEVTAGIDLSGKTFLLTGCNSGLGLETLRVLSLRGGHIIAAARTKEKAQNAIEGTAESATPVACDISEFKSVRDCVSRVKKLGRPLDGIICNAGIMALPKLHQKYGFELQFLTNHIGHFLLVTELLDILSENGRVVVVSSDAHRSAPKDGIEFDNLSGAKGYAGWKAYGQSKLANILFTRILSKKLPGPNQTANSLHPGVIKTNLTRHMNAAARAFFKVVDPLFLKSIAQGAATQCYLATHPQVVAVSDSYFADCNPAHPSKRGKDDVMAEKLWTVSEEIVARFT